MTVKYLLALIIRPTICLYFGRFTISYQNFSNVCVSVLFYFSIWMLKFMRQLWRRNPIPRASRVNHVARYSSWRGGVHTLQLCNTQILRSNLSIVPAICLMFTLSTLAATGRCLMNTWLKCQSVQYLTRENKLLQKTVQPSTFLTMHLLHFKIHVFKTTTI